MSGIFICRACLDTTYHDNEFIHLDASQIALFNYTLGVEISEQGPPGYLCPKCACILKEYGKFKKKCLKANSNYVSFVQSNFLKANPLFKPELVSDESSDFIEDHSVTIEELDPASPVYDDDDSINNKQQVKQELVNDQEFELGDDNIGTAEISVPNSPVDDEENQNVEDKSLKCDLCCIIIKNKVNFARHFEKCSKEYSNVVVCGLCEKTDTNQEQLKSHFLEHFKDNMLQCERCTYSGRDFADMVIHSYDHTKLNYKSCPCCLKRFHRLKPLEFHFRSDHLHKEGGLCSYCNKSIASCSKWLKHERLHADGGFVCNHCGKKFLYRFEIEEHLSLVMGLKPFMCDSCGMRFNRKYNLRVHTENKHKSQKQVKCSHCNKLYKNEAAYQKHVKQYKAERAHKCLECNKTFIYARHLKKHAFFHTNEKPFHCTICDKHYKTKASFKEHCHRHSGFKRFKCELCEMDFVTSSQLKVHQSVHTGVRRQQCSHCHRSFNHRKLLKQHCWKVHKIEVEFK